MYNNKNINRVNNTRNKNFNKNNKAAKPVDEEEEDEYSVKIEGRVVDALPNAHFRVETKDGIKISYLGGKMRIHKIRILVGDKVTLQLDEYGGKSRIIRRG
jgi:translation initiation factor IF-1